MPNPQRRIDPTALASLATVVGGVIAWPFLGGWAAMLAATLSLVLGFLGISRTKHNGYRGRRLAVIGIGLGIAFYVFLIVTIARDIIDPVQLQP